MRTGRVGFQREMNALSSLKAPESAEAQNVQALLQSTHEIELRVQQINRWWRLWRPDVRQGWAMLSRFRVRVLDHAPLHAAALHVLESAGIPLHCALKPVELSSGPSYHPCGHMHWKTLDRFVERSKTK